MATLAELYKKNVEAKGINSSLPSPVEERKNFIEGVGYLGEKAAVGFMSSVEGMWDFTASGIAKLFGADEWAEEQIANDWFGDWYSHPDEWFQPTGGWKIAGDVASGIGTSLPGLVAAVATGGVGAGLAAGLVSGLGAAGRNVKEAYEETGTLGGKEYLYGGLTGAAEGAVEGISNMLGLGSVGSIMKNLGKSATKSIAARVGKTVLDGFIGEAFEEGFSEFITPYIKKITYDPNAKTATAQEIGYAALVGGLSGAVMGGAGGAIDVSASLISGTKALNNGRENAIMESAQYVTEFDGMQQTGDEHYERIASSYNALQESLAKTGGKIETANQRMMLGDLSKANVEGVASRLMYHEAAEILNNAEAYAQRVSDYHYKDENGKDIVVTAEQLREGFDPENPSSIREALKTNGTLRRLAAMSVAGRMMADTSAMTDSILRGNALASQVDVNYLAEAGTAEEINALSEALGIADWSVATRDEINASIKAYADRGGIDEYMSRKALVDKIKSAKAGKAVPKILGDLAEGRAKRYTDGTLDIGVVRQGDKYLIYDFNRKTQSRLLTKDEVNTYLREYSQEKYVVEETKRKAEAEKRKAEVEELDTWARENVSDYAGLTAQNKSMLRKVIRDARKNGLSEAEVRSYARVSARSGVDIIFNKEKCRIKDTDSYYAGYFDPNTNKIVVNPNANKKFTSILIHELSHTIRHYKGIDNKIHYIPDDDAVMHISEKAKKAIEDAYKGQKVDVSVAELFADEQSAFYAEAMLGTDAAVDLLTDKRPNLKTKILSFFKGAIKDYEGDANLSREAKRQYKSFKRMFDAFSAFNKGTNAYGGIGEGGKRYSYSSISQSFFGGANIDVDTLKTYKTTQGYKDYVDKCVNNMRQTRPNLSDAEARAEIEDSIEGIVKVAIAAKKAGYDIADVEGATDKRDSKNRLLFSSLEPNSDYFTSNDIATICDKQKNMTAIYEEIVRQEEAMGVPENKRFFADVGNYFMLHKVLAEKGLTQACRQCYHDTMKKNLYPMAKSFIELVQGADDASNKVLYQKGKIKTGKENIRNSVLKAFQENDFGEITLESLNTEMLTTAEGLTTLRLQAPQIYELYNASYGQSKPKLPRGAAPYRFGELTAMLTDSNGKISKGAVDRINRTGGFRLQSYSDFQIENYVDVLQVIFEAGTLGLTGHAYTKVPAFLEATKGTNLKRNISIFMYKDGTEWRIDKNDSFPGELDDIVALVKADESGNTGIIDVVQNADNAAWVMANDDIAYGIPFHKSGTRMDVVRDTVVHEDGREIKGYAEIKDHTRQQTEVWAENGDGHKKYNKVKNGIDIYSFWDFDNKEGLTRNKLIEKNVKRYIDECRKLGYFPKFREYVIGNEKTLNDTLAYAKKLGFVGADATVNDISFRYGGYRIPYGYYKFLGDFSMFKPNGEASPHEVLSLKDYKFDDAEKFFKDAETVRRNEILQQIANGEKREELRRSKLTTSQINDIVEQKRREAANEVIGKRYKARVSIDNRTFTYNELVAKGDVQGVVIDKNTTVKMNNGVIDAAYVVNEVKKQCETTETNAGTVYFCNVPDINSNVEIVGNSVTHGFNRANDKSKVTNQHRTKAVTNARVALRLPQILRNSIEVNRAYRQGNNDVVFSHIMLGTVGLEDASGNIEYYAVRSVIEERANQDPVLVEADIFAKLHAVNAKKIGMPNGQARNASIPSHNSATYTYNIADLLNDVKGIPTINAIISQDVANSLGVARTFESKMSPSLRYSVDLDSDIETKVLTEMPESYKASRKEFLSSVWTSIQISLTNEQAGIEKIGKKLGIKDIEAKVQAVRAARNMAEEMIGGDQWRIGADGTPEKVGEGLAKIFSHISEDDEELFNTYLLHWHNTSRMTLEERSQAKIDEAQKDLDQKAAELVKANKELNKLVKQKEGVEPRSAEARAINKKLKEARAKVKNARKAANESKKAFDSLELEKNKPIFQKADGEFMTAEESKLKIAEIEKEHPEFKEIAEKVWAYNKNLNQYRVDTGLISQEDFDYLNEKYPYYVPTYRDGGAKGIVPIAGSHDLAVKQTVKTAKGSGKDVLPIKVIMARQTMETIRAGQINKLMKSLHDASGDNGEYISVVSRKKSENLEVNPTEQRPKDNQITYFENGEEITLAVTNEIFRGFEGFHGSDITDLAIYKAMNRANKLFKELVTSYSPAFMIRNPIRDIQDAGIYTKYGKAFARNYARAGKLISENSKEWQMYRAMGGLSASLFDFETGTKNSQNKWGITKEEGNLLQRGLDKIEQANVFLEQLPRFAEFLSAIEAGKSYEQAILDAADITTNFGRTGKITKILNATIIPFLNPSIQGFSKMIRSVTSVKTAREAGSLALKAAILGIAPMALNMLMYGDDDEYKDLRENDKENNFLIKIGDTFIKLPRGRVASALGGLVNRGAKTVKGEDADWKGYVENVSQQVTPVDSMTRTIFSPFYDLSTNTTWYGTEIEGRQFENVAPRDRYDESTSGIAKAIGKVLNYSPKKIHYLIDQYSGVIGDFILPLTSKKAEKDFFSGNFTIDPATSNKLSSDFYKLYDKAQYAKSAGDDTAIYQVKYLNSVKSAVSDLYKEKSAIQNSDLKGVEKLQQTRAVQILINEAFKTAIQDYDLYTKAFESTSAIEDDTLRYVESIRLTQGAERALEVYNKDVAAKYSLISKSGISYDELYYYYFAQKDIESDKDKEGNTVAGSKKQKVLKLVNSLNADKNQKLLLLAASGFSVGDKSTKVRLARYITSLNASKDEKAALAELCGYKVKNGAILMSSIK